MRTEGRKGGAQVAGEVKAPEWHTVIWFQEKRWSLKSKPHRPTRDRLRGHLLLLLLTARLLVAVLPQRKRPQGLLCCVPPGLHGAVLAQNCLQQEARMRSHCASLTGLPISLPPSSSKSSVAQERLRMSMGLFFGFMYEHGLPKAPGCSNLRQDRRLISLK